MGRLAILGLALWLAGCDGSAEGNDLPGADTLTQAERDSIIGASKLPGARAVQRALDVSDSAAARMRAVESIE
jgi:hypothetical protein